MAVARVLDIFVCRHGTTTWNIAKRWQGETDTELAPVGVEQAETTARVLQRRLPRVSRIFTSDLQRARRTAEIYAAALGCEVAVDSRLREPSLGRFESMHRDAIYGAHAELFARLARLGHDERLRTPYFQGLEAPQDTSRRVEALARELSAGAPTGEGAVLFVTHSKVLEAVLATVFGKFYDGIKTKTCAFFHWKHCEGAHELGDLHEIECRNELVED